MAAFSTLTLGVFSTISGLFGVGPEPAMETIDERPTAIPSPFLADLALRDPMVDGKRLFQVTGIDEVERYLGQVALSMTGDEVTRRAAEGSLRCEPAAPICRVVRFTGGRSSMRQTLSLSKNVTITRGRRTSLPAAVSYRAVVHAPVADPALLKVALGSIRRQLDGGKCDAITGRAGSVRIYRTHGDLVLPNLPPLPISPR
jgi:hypothetical protein